ncbi:MotA/TolQ/ExbB proton channel family protein [Acidiferrobacter sp.]|uniref:MotA/TolQ/ExbB proton channel family protein n=1 Tax=Acidiferrobacter sp. TaxID=1872107 RepID=UPI00261DF1D0|nr:MotA/TolQ/ExbB proton channel family protein [Acidiferrobacter sp.]
MVVLQYIVHLANYSDGVLYVLALVMTLEIAVIIDRLWFLRRGLRKGKEVIQDIARRGRVQREDLKEIVERCADLPEARLVEVAQRYFGLIHHYGSARGEAFANRLDEAIFLITPTLDKRLWLLDTIVTLAPLLGLFGTIIGMFHAFSILAVPGHAPTSVTAGVADALIATATGLFIAMVGLISFNAFNNAIEKIEHQLESLKVLLLNRMDGAPVWPEDGQVWPEHGEDRQQAAGRVMI